MTNAVAAAAFGFVELLVRALEAPRTSLKMSIAVRLPCKRPEWIDYVARGRTPSTSL
jgi:hypothetical protein